jgi:hypothetical protein
MFSGGKKTPPAALGDSAPPAKPASVASSTPKPAASTPPTPKPASTPVPSSPSLPVSKSSEAQFPPGQWVKVFTKAEDLPEHLRKPDRGIKSEDGWLRFARELKGRAQIDLPNVSPFKRNYAVRLHCLRSIPVGMHNAIVIRRQAGTERHYQFSVHQGNALDCYRRSWQDYTRLFSVRTPLVRPGTEYALEFGAVGDLIVGRYADEAAYLAKDSVFKEGGAYISGNDDIRDIEVINLDGLSEAEALKILGVDEKGNDLRKPAAVAATAPAPSVSMSPPLPVSPSSEKFPPGQWVKVFTKFEDLPSSLSKQENGVKWEDGRLTASKNTSWRLPAEFVMRNGGIRFAASRESKFELRIRDRGTHFYALREAKTLIRALTEAGGMKHANLAASRSARPSKDETVWEIVAIGNRVLARCDAELIGPSLDDSIREGTPHLPTLSGLSATSKSSTSTASPRPKPCAFSAWMKKATTCAPSPQSRSSRWPSRRRQWMPWPPSRS